MKNITERQNKDFEECVEMHERGDSKDCCRCSCCSCIAQEFDHRELLQECYNELTKWVTGESKLIDELKMVLGID